MTVAITLRNKTRTPPDKVAAPTAVNPVSLILADNKDGTFTVFGVDAAGATNHLPELVSSITITSANAAIVTGQVLHGTTFKVIPAGLGTANLTIAVLLKTATTQTITLPVTVDGSLAMGLTATAGTPTAA